MIDTPAPFVPPMRFSPVAARIRRGLAKPWRAAARAGLCFCLCLASAFAQTAPPAADAPGPPAADAPAAPRAAGQRPRIGLVLSGGGARGAAHIGVLEVLEQLHVPVDVIAGTSMGAIVGAAYASGATVEEMKANVARLNTAALFNDDPPRGELSMRAKYEELLPFIGPQFGVAEDGLRLPRGAVSGIALEAVLRELVKSRGVRDFDQLPIPFRAVATDISNGQMVVFGSGDLAAVLRASMSVPGLVAPLDLDGRLLVDGGLTRNLPVDVARALGADVIIAVNLGTPLLRRDQLGSIIGVSAQMIAILTEQNVQASLAQLRSRDILVSPELGDFSAGDFDNMGKIVPQGAAAAQALAERLRQYALPADEYAALRTRQGAPPRDGEPRIDVVRVEGAEVVNPEVLIGMMDTRVGAVFDQATLDRDLRRIYGRGDFAHVGYRLETIEGWRVLTVEVTEKPWGPAYLRFGLGLQSDLRGESDFDLYARYRRTWVNALGGEFRADARMGRESRLAAEFYQPLDIDQVLFVAPRVEVSRRPFEIYDHDVRVARFDEVARSAGLDAGLNLGRYVELRTGPVIGVRRFSLEIGPAALVPEDTRVRLGAWRTQLRIDALDSVTFPREGASLRTEVFAARQRFEGDDDYTRWESEGNAAFSFGAHTVMLGLKAGGRMGDERLPLYDQFRLGGPFDLSGYRPGQFLGQSMVRARLIYYGKIFDQPLLRGAFAGFALEAGRIGDLTFGADDRWRSSVAPFIAVDSPLGPVYFGLGFAPGGNRAVYLFLGRP